MLQDYVVEHGKDGSDGCRCGGTTAGWMRRWDGVGSGRYVFPMGKCSAGGREYGSKGQVSRQLFHEVLLRSAGCAARRLGENAA